MGVLSLSALAVVVAAPSAAAAYPVLGPGYYQRDWLTTPTSGALSAGATSVTGDGSLLLLVQPANGGSELRRYRPEDTTLTQGTLVRRTSDPDSDMVDVAAWGGRLFVSEQYDPDHDYGRLLELDTRTGAVIRTLFRWQFPMDVLVDPVTRGVLLFDCPRGQDCFATRGESGLGSTVTGSDDFRRIVVVDPDTQRVTELVPDTGTSVASQFGLGISNDGQLLFASHKLSGIDVFSRTTGRQTRSIPTGALVDWMRGAPPNGCFANQLVYQLDDGSIWSVDPRAPLLASRLVATPAQGLQFVGGRLSFDRKGRLVAVHGRLAGSGWVTVIDCAPIPPLRGDAPPTRQHGSHDRGRSGGHQPPAGHTQPPAAGHAGGGAPGPAAPPGTAQTAPATQPVTQPAQAPTFGQAAQGAPGSQPGLADAVEDTPQLGFSAVRRRQHSTPPAALWLAALVLAGAGAGAARALDPDLLAPSWKALP